MSVHLMHAEDFRDHKRVLVPLEMALVTVVLWVLGSKPRTSGRQ